MIKRVARWLPNDYVTVCKIDKVNRYFYQVRQVQSLKILWLKKFFFKGTLMQIWKSAHKFVFKKK